MCRPQPLKDWHHFVNTRDPERLDGLLDQEVTFHSPVVHTPQLGKAMTARYLVAAMRILGDPSFRYVREVFRERDAALEFTVEIEGISVNGVDLISWNDFGRITDFKVMIRPLKAIELIHRKMAALLEAERR